MKTFLLVGIIIGAFYTATAEDSMCIGDECWVYEGEGASENYINYSDPADGDYVVFDASGSILTADPPECPSGYGPIKIEFPESYISWVGYEFVEVECGRVVYE